MTNQRNKIGLYRDQFEVALKRHVQLPVRSERQSALSDLFVDKRQLDLVRNPDWQVVFGRRGTGKTMLLRVLEESHNRDFELNRILPVSVSAHDLLVSPVSGAATDRQKALAYFQLFLNDISRQLIARTDQLLGSHSFLARLTGSRQRLVDRIESTALSVLSLVEVGLPVSAFGDRKESADTNDADETSIETSGEAGVKAAPTIGFVANVKAHLGRRVKSVARKKTQQQVERAPRFALARAKILELLALLDIRRLDILIDEWQTLDPHGSTGIQPEFAEYLRRTFFGTPAISVKIATNRYQTRFSNRGAGTGYRGLELGADLFEATNLDRTEHSLADQAQFYTQLLFKRLLSCESRLGFFDLNQTGTPNDEFLLQLFRDRSAFDELLKGGGSTPRDFLLMFNALARGRDFSNNPTWTIPMVQDIVRDVAANLQEETDASSEADQLLTKAIRSVVNRTRSRLFLVDRDDRAAGHNAIEELVQKRLIDSYSSADLGPEIRTRYDAFLLHYGLWLDMRPVSVSVDEYEKSELPRIMVEDVAAYKVEMAEIAGDTQTCPHCGDHFLPNSRSVQIARLCPNCFQPLANGAVRARALRKSLKRGKRVAEA